MQDYGRALIVGDSSTHGKGTVQSVNNLRSLIRVTDRSQTNDPGALKLTIKEFFRPSGMSTQLKGVIPDIVLPSVANESKDIGESALDNPLPWDTIPSTKYDHFNLVEPYLGELRRRSVERVAADKEFAYVREDIELFKKRQADKTISLNERQRLKEQEENEARQKARDKERLTRPEPQEKVYEITLKQADLPGLPPPVARTNADAGQAFGSPDRWPFRGHHAIQPPPLRPAGIIPTKRKPRSRLRRTPRCLRPSTSWWITCPCCRKETWSPPASNFPAL